MRRLLALLGFLACVAPLPVWAVQPDEVLSDPRLETRARALSTELRCLVCQNQSIDDSAAPLARDLRLLVRERLTAGDSDAAVKQYLVARYGDFVLLKPPFKSETLLLWVTPPAVLLVGGIGALLARRNRRTGRDAQPLDEAETKRLDTLLRETSAS